MKKLVFTTISAGLLFVSSFAQTKVVVTSTIKTPAALCQGCKERIEAYLDRYDGIVQAVVNFRKGETRVKYITDRINIEEIKAAIANAGYDADDIEAEPGAYKRLPKTCKRAEDGGTHPKPKIPAPAQATD